MLGEGKQRRAFVEAKQSLEVKTLIEEQSTEQVKFWQQMIVLEKKKLSSSLGQLKDQVLPLSLSHFICYFYESDTKCVLLSNTTENNLQETKTCNRELFNYLNRNIFF